MKFQLTLLLVALVLFIAQSEAFFSLPKMPKIPLPNIPGFGPIEFDPNAAVCFLLLLLKCLFIKEYIFRSMDSSAAKSKANQLKCLKFIDKVILIISYYIFYVIFLVMSNKRTAIRNYKPFCYY